MEEKTKQSKAEMEMLAHEAKTMRKVKLKAMSLKNQIKFVIESYNELHVPIGSVEFTAEEIKHALEKEGIKYTLKEIKDQL